MTDHAPTSDDSKRLGVMQCLTGGRPDSLSSVSKLLASLQRWLAVAFAISLPLSMTASWILLTAGIVALILEGLITPDRVRLKLPLTPAILVFAAAVALSGLINGGVKEAYMSVQSLRGLLTYFWISNVFMRDRDVAQMSTLCLLIVGSVAGIWGTIQQIFDIHPTSFKYLQGTGFMSDPMIFAGQMQLFTMLALGLLLTLWSKADSTIKTKLYSTITSPVTLLITTLANTSGLIYALERGAWVGGLAGALTLTGLVSRRALLSCIIGMAALVTIGFFTVPQVHGRIVSAFSPSQDVSVRVRLEVWQRCIEEWKKSPVVGIGFLKFPHLDYPEAIVPGKSKDLNHGHSNYFHLLATTGVVGLLSYAWLCVAQLLAAFGLIKQARKDSDLWALGIGRGAFAALAALIFSGFFEYNFGTSQVRLAQWFVVALTSIQLTNSHRRASDTKVNSKETAVPDAIDSSTKSPPPATTQFSITAAE